MRINQRGFVTPAIGRRRRLTIICAVFALLASFVLAPAQPVAAAGETQDIVFLVDGSGSISADDWQIQKDGLSAAMSDATTFPRNGSIAVAVIQWSFVGPAQLTRIEVPLTVFDSQDAVDGAIGLIQDMEQIQNFTNPGDGIRAGTDLLLSDGETAVGTDWVLCLSTDGVTNSGEALDTAAAYASTNGVDRLSVVGIEDPTNGIFADDLRDHYGPHVFGDGNVTIARNSTEFATIVAGSCLGDPVELRALEVNQSIQDWTNSVPLITDKATAVRAFVEVAAGAPDQPVVGRLFGTRGGAELPASPLIAINSGGSLVATTDVAARRDDLGASLNFRLPASWRSGTISLRFEAGGLPVECNEPAGDGGDPAGDCTATVAFQDEVTPEIVYVAVPYDDGSGTIIEPTDIELTEQMRRMESVLPISDIDFRLDSLTGYASEPALGTVLTDLAAKRLVDIAACATTCTDETTNAAHYYGVLGGQGGGLGYRPGKESAGFLDSAGTTTTGQRNGEGYARNRGPHEFAHNLGRFHAVDDDIPASGGLKFGQCNAEAPDTAPAHTPFEDVGGDRRPVLGPLSSGVDAEIWGLDNRMLFTGTDLAVIDPRVSFELMSYCSGGPQARWISEYTYSGVMGEFEASGIGAPAPDGDEHLVVMVDAEAGSDAVTVRPAFTMVGRPPAPETGDHRIQLVAEDGSELAGLDVSLRIADGDSTNPDTPAAADRGQIVAAIPMPDQPIGAIRVLESGVQIGELVASDNAPEVTIVAPTGGEVLSEPRVSFDWSGSDPDGDVVFYTVLYSPDDGNTWDTLAINTTETSLEVARSTLMASSAARLQVIASDGVNTSTATSETFSVANNGPQVTISNPIDGTVFTGVQSVDLIGGAIDSEDGTLSGDSLVWVSDIDGQLGTGGDVTLNASDLSEGDHQISLTATDSEGSGATASVSIQVFRVGPVDPPPDTLTCGDVSGTAEELAAMGYNVVVGTDGKDTINLMGSDGPDFVLGLGGNDQIRTGGGDDVVCGGDGNDQISVGRGADRVFGEAGRDRILGDGEDDRLSGGADRDIIHGGAGVDVIEAGAGDDFVTGGRGDDELLGGDGNDILAGGNGDDSLYGEAGQDRLFGNIGADLLSGGDDDDRCNGGPQVDSTDGTCEVETLI